MRRGRKSWIHSKGFSHATGQNESGTEALHYHGGREAQLRRRDRVPEVRGGCERQGRPLNQGCGRTSREARGDVRRDGEATGAAKGRSEVASMFDFFTEDEMLYVPSNVVPYRGRDGNPD